MKRILAIGVMTLLSSAPVIAQNCSTLVVTAPVGYANVRGTPNLNGNILWSITNNSEIAFCGNEKSDGEGRRWFWVRFKLSTESWPHEGWISEKVVTTAIETSANAAQIEDGTESLPTTTAPTVVQPNGWKSLSDTSKYHAPLSAPITKSTTPTKEVVTNNNSSDEQIRKVVQGVSLFVLLLFLIGAMIAALPIIIAFHRRHEYRWIITMLTLFGGWTGLIWLGALIWSIWPNNRTFIDPLSSPLGRRDRNVGNTMGEIRDHYEDR